MGLLLLEASLLAKLPFFPKENRLLDVSRGYSKPLEGIRGVLAFSVLAHHALVAYAYRTGGSWKPPASRFYAQLGMIAVLLFFFMTAYLFWSKLIKIPELEPLAFYRSRVKRLWPGVSIRDRTVFCFGRRHESRHRNTSIVSIVGSAASWVAFTIPGQPTLNGVSGDPVVQHCLEPEGRMAVLSVSTLFGVVCPAGKATDCFCLFCSHRNVQSCSSVDSHATSDSKPLEFYVVSVLLATRYFLYLALFPDLLGGIIVAAIKPSPQLVKLACGRAGFLTLHDLPECHYLFRASVIWSLGGQPPVVLPFACIAWGNTWFGLLSCSPMRFLGRVSYSAYLLHLMVINAVYSLIPKSNGIRTSFVLAYCDVLG